MNKTIDPIEVKTLSDIKSAIRPLTTKDTSTPVSFLTEIKFMEKEKEQTMQIKCHSSGTSVRQMLLNGFERLKKKIDMLEFAKETAKEYDFMPNLDKINLDDTYITELDYFIQNRLGGKRSDLKICWDVEEGRFEFDPFQNKLYKIDNE